MNSKFVSVILVFVLIFLPVISTSAQESSFSIDSAKVKSSEGNIDFKGEKLSKIKIKEPFSSSDDSLTILITDINNIEGGTEVYTKAWRNSEQLGFGPDGSVEIERIKIINPPTMLKKEGVLVKDPEAALKETLIHIISIIGKEGANITKGKVGRTTTATYPTAGANSPVDGIATQDFSTSWSTTRNSTNGGSANNTSSPAEFRNLYGNGWGSQYFTVVRAFLLFDTSSIPDNDTVSNATLSLYGSTTASHVITGSEQRLYAVSASPSSNNTIITTDFDNVGSTSFGETDNSWDTNGYNVINLNSSGTSSISLTALTKFGIRGYYDFNNVPPTNSGEFQIDFIMADRAGTTYDPVLIVQHSHETTVRIYANTSDGYTTNSYCNESGNWSSARSYSGSFSFPVCDTQDVLKVRSDSEDNAYQIYRGSMVFDTSIIPDTATITAATMNIYGTNTGGDNTGGVVFTSHSRTSTTTLASGDWHITDYGSTSFGSSTSSLTPSAYNEIDLTSSGLTHINDTGSTVFGILSTNDFNNSDPNTTKKEATFVSANATGTSTDPYIEITYID